MVILEIVKSSLVVMRSVYVMVNTMTGQTGDVLRQYNAQHLQLRPPPPLLESQLPLPPINPLPHQENSQQDSQPPLNLLICVSSRTESFKILSYISNRTTKYRSYLPLNRSCPSFVEFYGILSTPLQLEPDILPL